MIKFYFLITNLTFMSITVAQLRSFAISFGFSNVSKLSKLELLQLLKFPHDEVESFSPKKKAKKVTSRAISHNLTLSDYREFAKEMGFINVSKMKKAELMKLLKIPEQPQSNVAHLTVAELREFAASFGFTNINKLKRQELIDLLHINEYEVINKTSVKKTPVDRFSQNKTNLIDQMTAFMKKYEVELTDAQVDKVEGWIAKVEKATSQPTLNTITRAFTTLQKQMD